MTTISTSARKLKRNQRRRILVTSAFVSILLMKLLYERPTVGTAVTARAKETRLSKRIFYQRHRRLHEAEGDPLSGRALLGDERKVCH